MDPVTIRMAGDEHTRQKFCLKRIIYGRETSTEDLKGLKIFAVVALFALLYLGAVWTAAWAQLAEQQQHVNDQQQIGLSLLDEDPIPDIVLSDQHFFAEQVQTTTTEQPEPHLTIDDLFISVKTTKRFHKDRLDVILKTWFKLARDQTYFFTDEDDEQFSKQSYNHLVNTGCPPSHNRQALCCKMGAEFDHYLQSRKKWWCHFDDDNYVNVPQLLRDLQQFDYRQEWYLGKTSIKDPLETRTRGKHPKDVAFWFGTGGAGFCVSQSLALRMKPIASNGRFTEVGESIRLPDDVTMGYIIEVLLRKQLTVLPNFHSHLESLGYIDQDTFKDQISFSYSSNGNVLSVDTVFDYRDDPTRFISVHCHLFPQFDICKQMEKRAARKSKFQRMRESRQQSV